MSFRNGKFGLASYIEVENIRHVMDFVVVDRLPSFLRRVRADYFVALKLVE